MGCRMSTEVWQVAGWNVLEERKKRGKARTERRTRDGYRRVGTNEGEKYQSDGERQEDGEVIPADEQAKGRKMERDKSAQILA